MRKRAVLNLSAQVRRVATLYQARPKVAGRSPSTENCNARRWAPTWCCPAPIALVAILLRTQYNASHYALHQQRLIIGQAECRWAVGTYGSLTKAYRRSGPRQQAHATLQRLTTTADQVGWVKGLPALKVPYGEGEAHACLWRPVYQLTATQSTTTTIRAPSI
jgi:hypothetical protein